MSRTCFVCDVIGSALVLGVIAGMGYCLWDLSREKQALARQIELLSGRPASCPMVPAPALSTCADELAKLRAAALKVINTPRMPGALRAAVDEMRVLVPGAEKQNLECR